MISMIHVSLHIVMRDECITFSYIVFALVVWF